MKTTMMLRALANGINPDTGELLSRSSVAHAPDMIRQLFALSEEFAQQPPEKKTKLSPEERQQKNIAEGKPAKSFFPWSDDEKQLLEAHYRAGKTPEVLSQEFCRSVRAVAIQLEKMGLITAEQLLSYGL
ncbi:hypothetical protein MUA04_06790 [Enterobacteriaceae bacterium H11S18]|uniref:hypothetical protein n=1 Tax=Enterobacteriaceae TaxID=543 RepID=UPI0019257284|nr:MULTISPECIES: hypothetical protein [Enterobacteriaceae]MCT4707514.1 hypothetical protein [Dryocola clanedunensis]MCT4709889.1 hypothetical protein [Dryocola clanedunensis]